MELTERFADVINREHVPLDEAVALVGAHADPTCYVAATLAELDHLAGAVDGAGLPALVGSLFGVAGFRGADDEHYYDPRNSYLHLVVARRIGLPITLSVVLMEVGRRVGVDLVGIGGPSHFVTRLRDDADCYVDAFRGGRLLDRRGVDDLYAALAPGVDIEPFLAPLDPVDIVRRVLGNLVLLHRRRGDQAAVLWATELRMLLPAASADDQRAFGAALAARGDFARAAKVLFDLADAPEVADPQTIRLEAHKLRARLN